MILANCRCAVSCSSRSSIELGLPLFSQEVEIDGIEDDSGPGHKPSDGGHVLFGNIRPRDDGQLEIVAVLLEVGFDRRILRWKDDLDALALQILNIWRQDRRVIRHQNDMMPGLPDPAP